MVNMPMEKQRWLGYMSHEDGRDDKTRQLIHFGWRGWQRKAEKLMHSDTWEGQISFPPILAGC